MTPTYCIIWALLPLASCWVWRMEALAGGQRSGENHAGAFWSRLASALTPPYPLLTTLAGCWPLPGPAPTKLRNSDLSPCSLGMGMGMSVTSHYCQSQCLLLVPSPLLRPLRVTQLRMLVHAGNLADIFSHLFLRKTTQVILFSFLYQRPVYLWNISHTVLLPCFFSTRSRFIIFPPLSSFDQAS